MTQPSTKFTPSAKNANALNGIASGAEVLALAEISAQKRQPILFVARDDALASFLIDALHFFAPQLEVLSLPAWDCLPYDRVSPHASIVSERMHALSRLALHSKNPAMVIVTTANAFTQRVLPQAKLYDAAFEAKVGDSIQREKLQHYLVRNSYRRVGTATEPGEFATRGSIIDIMPPDAQKGLRLDFMGDVLETIRHYDPLTQLTEQKVQQIALIPASEILLEESSINLFRTKYRELFGNSSTEDPLYQAITEGRQFAGMEHWLPLFYENLERITDYLPEHVLAFDHTVPELLAERNETIAEYYDSRKQSKSNFSGDFGGAGYRPLPPEYLYLTPEEQAEYKPLQFSPFGGDKTKPAPDLYAESAKAQQSVFEQLKIIMPRSASGEIMIIACVSEGSRTRMEGMLKDHEITSKTIGGWHEAKTGFPGIYLALLALPRGFIQGNITVFSEADILGEKIIRKPKRKGNAEKFLAEAASLSEGELVVHKDHGIGKFVGLETLVVSGIAHDCLKLLYQNDDRLFVPVENLDLITRYGSDHQGVLLDRLGAAQWQARKARLKERIKMAAQELIKVAAERAIRTGDILEKPSGLFEEFCARFPYAETEDQLTSIEDVLNDMASGKPMDRLVCGDVGFGKTEVAMRAAFIAANFGQVAIITPTTLLCRQHFNNFTERFKGFPMKIRQLSRLVTAKEAKQTKLDLAEGKVDIVIGTHALMAKDIKFKHLNLVVVDEEQHFGVKQKEAMKKLRAQTHVLTLTATPIPRTLQMSLAGVRDLSIIASPPVDRLAVRTYVMPYDPVVIREALLREHFRGGSSFYICPRIQDMEDVEKHLKALVPEVKIRSAHGQMTPTELETIMTDFYEGRFDVLLSTSIVESGIDVPRANTLIIHRADQFGLAQLYQLRGRVGRSRTRAYAYLTFPPKRILTKDAEKRLEVMQMLDSLGAGFMLASYDMDIRGYGNLLGEEQSGNIKEVGMELYQQMLEEAVMMQRMEDKDQQTENFSPQINIGASVLIPETYVQDMDLRLSLYRRIGTIAEESEIESLAAEMIDRFGPLPTETTHLLSVIRIKLLCKQANIEKVDTGEKGAVLTFHNNHFAKPDALLNLVSRNIQHYKLRPDQKVALINQGWGDIEKRITGTYEVVKKIAALAT
jgi:transcription-repair coupling factor (superfamily II helicase)